MAGKDSIRLVFTGDIAFSENLKDGWRTGCLAPETEAFLRGGDFVAANIECPLTGAHIESRRALNHAGDPGAGAYLASENIRIWSLANNHIMDCKAEGVLDTLRCAEENGCRVLGAGKDLAEALQPLVLGEDVRVGLLGFSLKWPWTRAGEDRPGALTAAEAEKIRAAIAALREKADWVILVIHGGEEYCDLPFPYHREQYREYLEWGADIIVAHHPHVVQNYERFGGKMVFYSLGNFIFDTDNQRIHPHTDTGVLLGIDLRKDGFSFDAIGTRIDRETGTVGATEPPAVFCEIGEEEYRKLWPLAVKEFYPEDVKNQKVLSRRLRNAPKWEFFLFEIYSLRHRRFRVIHKGRLASLRRSWEKSALTDAAAYLQGREERG